MQRDLKPADAAGSRGMRKKRLAALAAEEAARAARRADEAFMKEAVRQAKKRLRLETSQSAA